MSWSPTQYEKFEAERNRPVRDLLAQVPEEHVTKAVDLGCGPGNSTEFLRERFPQANILGVDSSPEMIEQARRRLPGVRFELGDIGNWAEPGPFDLIFANASLQWVPNHAELLPALFGKLAAGGTIAVQIPDNLDEPAHRLMREVAAEGPWSSKLARAGQAREDRHSADWYFQVLSGLGTNVNVWRTTYYHALAGGVSGIVEWFKGTGLRPFLQPLDEQEQEAFLDRYKGALAKEYSVANDGTALLPFPRLFFVATRG